MLIGTLIGSLLGTVVNAIVPHVQNNKVPIPGFEIIIPQIFANLILGFIVGITLMRKKDVQSFLTVEDFWGGILLGFLVGYSGGQFLKGLLPK
jgi:fluoride ion exporter CrcB/FEX